MSANRMDDDTIVATLGCVMASLGVLITAALALGFIYLAAKLVAVALGG